MKTRARDRLPLEDALQVTAEALQKGNDVEIRNVEGGFLVFSVRKKQLLREQRPDVVIDTGKESVTIRRGRG